MSPALAPGQAGPRYFGLIVGGVLPAAQLADNIVTSYDPCVQVHNPTETISTSLEAKTVQFLLDLLDLPKDEFTSNTLTTGATASNLLGLALGRDFVVSSIQQRKGLTGYAGGPWQVSEDGLGGVEVEVLVAGAHASVVKVSSILGLGRRSVIDFSTGPCRVDFDLAVLDARLQANFEAGRGSIVVLAYGEVNTGGFNSQTRQIRALCNKYSAWLHIDAAFGAFAVLLPQWRHLAAEMALADSITSDAHKCESLQFNHARSRIWLIVLSAAGLNTPYDCGLFFARPRPLASLFSLAGPGASPAAYLTATVSTSSSHTPHLDPFRALPSPLFVNIENSRRFRALPVYAALVSLGRDGYRELFRRNVEFAGRVAEWMRRDGRLEVLTPEEGEGGFHLLNVVLFAPGPAAPKRFQGAQGATVLREEINGTKRCHVTGTVWEGRGANRLAVSNWATEWERDGAIVTGVLQEVLGREG